MWEIVLEWTTTSIERGKDICGTRVDGLEIYYIPKKTIIYLEQREASVRIIDVFDA